MQVKGLWSLIQCYILMKLVHKILVQNYVKMCRIIMWIVIDSLI